MKILIDMNLSPDWVAIFDRHEIEAIHWSSIGDPRERDTVIMEWSRINQYIVFTHDLDFGSLLASTGAEIPSVIQVRTQDTLPSSIGDLVIMALRQFESELEFGALLTVDKFKSRVRILPIRRG
jgi:predicted nuclease of predicted toxin-antitoxin system